VDFNQIDDYSVPCKSGRESLQGFSCGVAQPGCFGGIPLDLAQGVRAGGQAEGCARIAVGSQSRGPLSA
jgi:hypothetical protein